MTETKRSNSSWSRRTGLIGAAVATSLLIAAGQASATSIGLNFPQGGGTSGQDTLNAADLAGAPGYAQTNWNNVPHWSGWNTTWPAAPTTVQDNTGAAVSGLQFSWNDPDTWHLDNISTSTPNGKLMYGYLDSNGTVNTALDPNGNFLFGEKDNEPDMWAGGLSGWLASQNSPSYSVVVYIDGDNYGANGLVDRVGEYWIQSQVGTNTVTNDTTGQVVTLGPDLTGHIFVKDHSQFDGTFTQVTSAADSLDNAAIGNYIVFSGLTANQFILRANEVWSADEATGGDLRAPINAVQIIAAPASPVPEPTSLALLALGGLALATRRRRTRSAA